MYRIILIVFLTCYFLHDPESLHAQNFKGGAVLGINACQVDGDQLNGYNKLGLMAGAYVYRPVSNYLDIQLEIKYMGKGATKKKTEININEYRNTNLHYIEIPVIARFNVQKLGVEAGFGFGYLFSAKIKDDLGEFEPEPDEQMKPLEFSGIGGLNYKATPKLSVNIRYSYSILSIRQSYRIFFNNIISTGIFYHIGN
jgi:hypothetical protein